MKEGTLERFVKSFGFSLLCFILWMSLGALRARTLLRNFGWMEVVWLTYNLTLAGLFLVRSRPSIVTLNPIHWLVALLASFSGLLFEGRSVGNPLAVRWADALILVGLAGSGLSGLTLCRSYDFVPALCGVTTRGLYRFMRHPMYVFSMLIRLAYVIKHPSIYNAVVFLIVIGLYDRRADFEEQIMRNDPRYRVYMERVRFRFIPGIY